MMIARPATEADALALAPNLRSEDIAEVRAASGLDPALALLKGVLKGRSWAWVDDEGPAVIFGVVPYRVAPHVGAPWLLASHRAVENQWQLLRVCRPWVERLGEGFQYLANYVDARNTVHHRWLRWCGFTIGPIHPEFGVERLPFYEFHKQCVISASLR